MNGDHCARQPLSASLALVLIGVIVGVGLTVWVYPSFVDQPSSVANRWHVWEGDSPLFGDLYESEEECEQARKAHLMGELAKANSLPKFPGQVSADDELEKAKRAYCRTLPN
jgi:hypothetical protein